jgi:beta-glucosidase
MKRCTKTSGGLRTFTYRFFKYFAIVLILVSSLSCSGGTGRTNQHTSKDFIAAADEKKIDSIVAVMSLDEKVAMLCGNGMFSSAGVERLGIGELYYSDGPFGIREELEKKSWTPLHLTTDSATFFPTGSALAATWNPELAYQYGNALGEEAKSRNKDFLLGPAVNITRVPVNGRTFEYMSEDPLLNSRLAVDYIKGAQKAGVAACVKHFALNNQETNRGHVSVVVDERALREIYLPAFKAAVTEGNAYAVMSAYNKFRGTYCGENDYLLNKILKGEWGFRYVVMSDWGGTHSTVKAALGGLDIEMGTASYFTLKMVDSVKKGLIPESVIDDKVKRILRVASFTKTIPAPTGTVEISTPAHNLTAYEVACQSIVLLKNSKKTLPLDVKQLKSVAVIGYDAIQKLATGGFGANVKACYEITPLEGLKNRIGNAAAIEYADGYKPKYVREKFQMTPVNIADPELISKAVEVAKKAETAILFVGNNRTVENESQDRQNLELPFGQDELIKAVCAANPNTIIVIVAGAPVDLHVADSCSASLVWSWINGSQGGNALADVLLGNVNPSGKLPFTIPVKLNDSPAFALGTFPGNDQAVYSEGILVGYRWFDTKNIKPMYCFGYGLSYTDFAYSGLKTDKKTYAKTDSIVVTLNIKNTGKRNGYETVQLYASELNCKMLKAAQELKAFKKIMVNAGASTAVTLKIAVADLAWYDEKTSGWVVNPGKYRLSAGSSSRDIRGVVEISVK